AEWRHGCHLELRDAERAAEYAQQSLAVMDSSFTLIEVLKQGRADLQPWAHTTAVRALDDRLTAHGPALT
ncbi:MAG: hypothetical protein ACRDRV_15295, partial [Pseudonocardiaceae bacterium]